MKTALCLLLAIAATPTIIVLVWLLVQVPSLLRLTGYHATPRPDGMLARYELPEHDWPLGGCSFRIDPETSGRLEVDVGRARHSIALPGLGAPAVERSFDFDGDGVEDRIECEALRGRAVVRVICGAEERVLFRHSERLAYTPVDRAFGLPDLDGDGRSELALYHPREDRSAYDFEFVDMLLDVKSWVTIVSHAE